MSNPETSQQPDPQTFRVGPPPAMPPMCFPCITGICDHRNKLGDVHGGGLVPAITTHEGTQLCLDCAVKVTGRAEQRSV